MKRTFYFLKNAIIAHPAWFFLVAALLWGGLMFLISIIRGKFDLDGLLTEANGMVFDLLVFGILLSIYEKLREKRDKIERLHEEIDDYREWSEDEAMYRIVGAVKRLNKLGVSKIDLTFCFLEGANLSCANLQGANLTAANLQGALFDGANLQGAYLLHANVGKDWFEELEKRNIKGREKIKAKYLIDENGVLREKQ